ncbi:uncharacterized protein MICPUCDRAFT_36082 [Micromonas pusilla CCMP1545]|uniref:monodehydroascorbate reductase (NADH) n=1 Tax=Micromonas pusilla (strain CCMP1545) TaxID=564608 RepID=C1N4L4_MICPC|nr:uncharacterized protein MICPUCDRAFT_36082 [Micromonas pusilla CCMP1545]EEH52957.1 predicted protein [Micromonas pusilla CCMP1545]|eukprot:XP_003063018.1 predicted protein [Micromonas pusilla CCMP1545]
MSAIAKKIVLVGGGNAAGYFARAVVAAGRGAELTMIAAENVLPYERPALTKAFLHAESPARLPGFHTSVGGGGERQTAEWYATHGVEVILGTRVVDANLEEKTVVTDAGKSYSYDKLVVAIGCTALKLPSAIGGDLPGVHRVRDVADALALCDAMDGCAKGSVVIGGGYVGLEVAAALATRGLSPRVVMMEPHIMSRLWTREIAEKYEKLYEAKGTTFHRGAKVAKIIAGDDGRAAGVELDGGATLECDVVVVGVGAGAPIEPFARLAAAPAPTGGIAVDGTFAASGEGIEPKSVYAIGDVAAFPLKRAGGALRRVLLHTGPHTTARMEHVAHARASAAHAAKAVLDPSSAETYDYLPYFYSRVFEHAGSERKVAWVFYGAQPEGAEVVVVGELRPKLFAAWIDPSGAFYISQTDGTTLVGAMLESGDGEEVDVVKSAAERCPKVDVDALKKCATVEDALALVAAA